MSSSRGVTTVVALILAFGAIAVLADYVVTRLVLRSEATEAGRIGRVVYGRDPNEIPIFGASKAESNYIPAYLGSKVYNYGFSSASPDVTNFLLEFELRKESRQPILIDLHQGAFQDIGDKRNFLPVADQLETRRLLETTGNWRWYYGFVGLRYFGSWDWYLKGLLTDVFALTKLVERGYVRAFNALPWEARSFAADVEKRRQTTLNWGIFDWQEKRLRELIRRAGDRMIVIVLSPLHGSFLEKASGEADFRKWLAKLAAEETNVRVLDFTQIGFPDNFFMNTGHLNYEGARVFSLNLRNRLIDFGVDVGHKVKE